MEWILIIMFTLHLNTATSSEIIPFNTIEECDFAAKAVKATLVAESKHNRVVAVCLPRYYETSEEEEAPKVTRL